jgi:hypothetical protein
MIASDRSLNFRVNLLYGIILLSLIDEKQLHLLGF